MHPGSMVWTRGTDGRGEGHNIPDHSHSYMLYLEPLSCRLHQPYVRSLHVHNDVHMLATGWVFPSPSSVLGIQAVIQKRVQLPYTIFSTLIAMYRCLICQTTKASTTCTAEHPEDSRSAQEPVGTEHNSPSAMSTVDTSNGDVASSHWPISL